MAVDAIFEDGVLKPLNALDLSEHQRVHLLVQTDATAPSVMPKQWHWREAQALDDGYAGDVTEELLRQRREP